MSAAQIHTFAVLPTTGLFCTIAHSLDRSPMSSGRYLYTGLRKKAMISTSPYASSQRMKRAAAPPPQSLAELHLTTHCDHLLRVASAGFVVDT
ncbi:hypothetical protein E2P81_ATG11750 [Venturia nashicola]|uniref:Uncharacterized protein n=1 Tax=Venturia nashicola TaxID=86259 RepID=A0A4Z1P3L1_9PEZI|nr:hypothetical protein E6O75_ATG11441 [Venturia nashicola]TLD24414.1 hypothetical protein E2P81_ATG11750 [Venturia nashicola]